MTDAWVRTAGLASAALLLFGGAAAHTASASPAPGKKPAKVTLCHRTNSEVNPYVRITVSTNAADAHGHRGHTGPVYAPGMKPDHVKWGDIIPPTDDSGAPFPSMNWSSGQAIWQAGCKVAQPTPTTAAPATTAPPTTAPPTTAPADQDEETATPSAPGNPGEEARVEGETLDRTEAAPHARTAAAAAPAHAVAGSPGFTG